MQLSLCSRALANNFIHERDVFSHLNKANGHTQGKPQD